MTDRAARFLSRSASVWRKRNGRLRQNLTNGPFVVHLKPLHNLQGIKKHTLPLDDDDGSLTNKCGQVCESAWRHATHSDATWGRTAAKHWLAPLECGGVWNREGSAARLNRTEEHERPKICWNWTGIKNSRSARKYCKHTQSHTRSSRRLCLRSGSTLTYNVQEMESRVGRNDRCDEIMNYLVAKVGISAGEDEENN